jgi:hypothetical protein
MLRGRSSYPFWGKDFSWLYIHHFLDVAFTEIPLCPLIVDSKILGLRLSCCSPLMFSLSRRLVFFYFSTSGVNAPGLLGNWL